MTDAPPRPKREKLHWTHLYDEVVTSGLCTGCAGCVIACPHDVLGYEHGTGKYKPFHLEEEEGPGGCIHGDKGCTSCTRACPRFRDWEVEADTFLFERVRTADEIEGISKDIVLARASDEHVHEVGQDGGLVSAILIWALQHEYIDAALVSYLEGDGTSWQAVPGVARTPEEVLAAAGSRYTYSANTMAYADAVEGGAEKIALVGMSCQSSVPPIMSARKAGKVARRLSLSIGLLCSKTFDDAIFEELLLDKYGLRREEMVKMNIKGRLQIWMRNGDYHEVPLKECHPFTREGCTHCPDFAAEHADISTGGIGAFNDWTLTIVRTDIGREIMGKMQADGTIQVRPGDDDPGAIALMRKLSAKSRKRWPETAVDAPRLLPPAGAHTRLNANPEERAAAAVVHAGDLPAGWEALEIEEGGGSGLDDEVLDACASDAFPHGEIVATAESPSFRQAQALVYSVAVVTGDETAAGEAFACLSAEGFAACFATSVVGDMRPPPGAAQVLGDAVRPLTVPHLRDGVRAGGHRVELTAGTAGGVFPVRLDVVALHRDEVVSLVFLADTPGPFAADVAVGALRRLAGRL